MRTIKITPRFKDDPSGIVELIIKTDKYHIVNGEIERVQALGHTFKDDMFDMQALS